MKQFVLTPRAEQDISDIWDFIAGDKIEAADRVLEALEQGMAKLAKTPGIGHWREQLTDKRHWFFLVYSYLIVYRRGTRPPTCRPRCSKCSEPAAGSAPVIQRALSQPSTCAVATPSLRSPRILL
jgi:toxin ParE1/3/4